MEQKVKGGDKRKVRRENAVHVTTVLFDHARDQQEDRLNRIAMQASAEISSGIMFSSNSTDNTDLFDFASEVTQILHGVSAGEFGIIDPSFIMNLIMSIVQAIAKCKEVLHPPTPTPVPTPAPVPV
jgi:hypothetical protein